MKETVSSSNTTNSAMFTVILILTIVVIKKITSEACIFAESNSTLFAVCLHLLASVTFCADKLFKLLPIESVCLSIVVTKSTGINLPTTRTLQGEKSFVSCQNRNYFRGKQGNFMHKQNWIDFKNWNSQ